MIDSSSIRKWRILNEWEIDFISNPFIFNPFLLNVIKSIYFQA